MQPSAGLYIHVPFCRQKCGYCDFYSITSLEKIEAFCQALLTEIQMVAPRFAGARFETVYLGGGTPSLLSEDQFSRIWQALHNHFSIDPEGEFSLEANPGTLTEEKLHFLRRLGFNRLSLGVQSFNPDELRFLGRIHSVEDVLASVEAARRAGFDNINLDLMTAFPGLTRDAFTRSLSRAVALRPEHISCYTLIFEPGTLFYKRMERGELVPLPEEAEAEYYQLAEAFLGEAGYQAYEISNFARQPAFRCRHNLIYWTYRPYLGLGPSAHSFWNDRRWANHRSLERYCRNLAAGQLPVAFQETLDRETQMFEYLYLHLRLREGLDRRAFQLRFGEDPYQLYGEKLDRLVDLGVVTRDDRRVTLTSRGWLVADEVVVSL